MKHYLYFKSIKTHESNLSYNCVACNKYVQVSWTTLTTDKRLIDVLSFKPFGWKTTKVTLWCRRCKSCNSLRPQLSLSVRFICSMQKL